MSDPNDTRFFSQVGHQPWFFVPDTGSPGGSAVLVAPGGASAAAVETQLSPAPDPVTGERTPGRWGLRVGFQVPAPFSVEGEHQFVITQDDAVTVYTIVVEAAQAPRIDMKG